MARLATKFVGIPTIAGFVLLPLVLSPCASGGQRKASTPTCDVRVDLQYEMRPGIHVTLAGQPEVAPEVARLIMTKAGEMHWGELTKHGKKYPNVCLDGEHPYYVLVWKVADW